MPSPATHHRSTKSGPDVKAELGWLLDDAIEGINGAAKGSPHSKKMSSVLALGKTDAEQLSVSMRIDLSELDRLWQQRIRERQGLPFMQTFKPNALFLAPMITTSILQPPGLPEMAHACLAAQTGHLAVPYRSNAVSLDAVVW